MQWDQNTFELLDQHADQIPSKHYKITGHHIRFIMALNHIYLGDEREASSELSLHCTCALLLLNTGGIWHSKLD